MATPSTLQVSPFTVTEVPQISVTVTSKALGETKSDMILVLVEQTADGEGDDLPLYDVSTVSREKQIDDQLQGALREMIEKNDFKATSGSSTTDKLSKDLPMKIAGLYGLGKRGDNGEFSSGIFDKIGSFVVSTAKSNKLESITIILPPNLPADAACRIGTSCQETIYVDNRFRSGSRVQKPAPLKELTLIPDESESATKYNTDIEEKIRSIAGVHLARDLVAAPPNVVTPQVLAEVATQIAQNYSLTVKILEEDEIAALKMGSYLGVAQGAVFPPKFIHLTYKAPDAKRKVAAIGKGLTFDSGGYNLKVGGSMIEKMKFDMGGAAAVLGAAKAVGIMQPKGVEAHFIIAACENMISDRAMRPGDILTASNGKTIEVINTDAEGRLTLADALVYAEKLGIDEMVDIATLTGACMVALGTDYAGLWSSHDELLTKLEAASSISGDKVWKMPLAMEYKDALKSSIADLKNVGDRWGGSITAALFLKEFVEKTPWAHIDMAGTVWDHKAGGATGYGVKLLAQWIAAED